MARAEPDRTSLLLGTYLFEDLSPAEVDRSRGPHGSSGRCAGSTSITLATPSTRSTSWGRDSSGRGRDGGRGRGGPHDELHEAANRALADALTPFSTGGVYVNFLGDEGRDRIRSAYGDATYERLSRLKARMDPANLFRLNQNIEPNPGIAG